MLANMSQNAEMPSLTWNDLGVSELLPTGTVTLLLADVEGSTRLWETAARADDRRAGAAESDGERDRRRP